MSRNNARYPYGYPLVQARKLSTIENPEDSLLAEQILLCGNGECRRRSVETIINDSRVISATCPHCHVKNTVAPVLDYLLEQREGLIEKIPLDWFNDDGTLRDEPRPPEYPEDDRSWDDIFP